ncbi:electron transfer flavoprotein subunit alpha/FixB family protein [Taylorella equigenitalis]|uniref:electron transfer flavoprotein subunit alpha/FixB family protein n=1 Tax=Taylorella equigenitalis TaxID=29575 RepID=UPI000406AEE5|nr:FAD-binding protein [Taylorella equigenitalis]ASY37902.1 electron transfer flavoprotein subunit alpha [Taylorella equigenitalis]ASY42322.1 electron transfer flavoprotein subunit alpha [Taylorella equigenitalis]KGK32920.1 electron transfer flavoprotein subunit beta [Taylorella equigenitalis]RBA26036.1 electron transfer flavoprotein subunit alpha [Taylorella equigenitalis]WDU47272.1 FAD-binding protein [Taylorella equigenitalis]
MKVLVIADYEQGVIKPSTLSTIAAAQKLSMDIDLLLAGKGVESVASIASQYQGVSKVLVADGDSLDHNLAENLSKQVLKLAESYSHILFSASSVGKSTAPRVAAKLDVPQVSEITSVIDSQTFERPIYAGNAIATVQTSEPKVVITVRATAFDAVGTSGGSASVESVETVESDSRVKFISQEMSKSERPELSDAKIVISGGRALGSAENFQMLYELADKLGAAVGASRAAVDMGFAPNDLQVGQTGKIVAPQLYIAVGISGAIQHLAGMKDSKVIVAINKDPEAPIFNIADYGLVGDLFEIIPQLNAAL